MTTTLPLEQLSAADRQLVGGKAVALAELARRGYQVPRSLAITTDAYRRYLTETGLESRVMMELGRKEFREMRWEELWDAALRIRNLFLTTPLPAALQAELTESLSTTFLVQPLVIRSSAPGEDAQHSSFAGLHDSFVNLRERADQLLAIRKVWASLWSDRALLYRQELGLSVEESAMAVLVQELVTGEKSGVAFSRSPNDSQQLTIEAVPGLNQGLVDGSVEPDSWTLDRQSLEPSDYRPAERTSKLIATVNGLSLARIGPTEQQAPLTQAELQQVAKTVLELEKQFAQPQDIEWTLAAGRLVLLQARPITTSTQEDPRSWYLSLHRNLENLKQLQTRIEAELLPGMEATAAELADTTLEILSDQELAAEIQLRKQIQHHWEEAYRCDCIPMAHGIRLFGVFYNDTLQPENPFEFIELLRGGELRAVARNQQLARLAAQLSAAKNISAALNEQLEQLSDELGLAKELVRQLLQQLNRQPNVQQPGDRQLEAAYLQHFSPEELPQALELLAIGRASYRLRDDDNISLNKLSRELQRAVLEAKRRLETAASSALHAALENARQASSLASPPLYSEPAGRGELHARQLQGQPASPGLATAPARVLLRQTDLAEFQRGEILVCDAIDPAMTFIVPLAAGIVERRGGMLIHGAIIAREYGIPCVSGIAAAADIINTGDRLTIDGNLGLVFFPPGSGLFALPKQEHLLRKELDDAHK